MKKDSGSKQSNMDKVLEKIAQDFLYLDTLETRMAGCDDFKEMAVWDIKAALEAAYKAGQESK